MPVVNQLTSYIERVGNLADTADLDRQCRNYLAFYQCTAAYTPCNETTMKIYAFCENSCEITNQLTVRCLNFTQVDPNLIQYISQFNCSNPLTYASSLTLDFYQEPPDDMCNAIFEHLSKHTDNEDM